MSQRKTPTQSERKRRGRARTQSDAALSSFKTMWRGRLIWSPKWLLLPHIAAPLKRIHTHTHTRITTQTYACKKRTLTPICLHKTPLSLLHMSNPDVLPTYISSLHPPSLRIKRTRKHSRARCAEEGERERANGKSGVFYWGSKIGRKWRDTEHKQRAQSKGWASETAAMSQQCKGGIKQRGRMGWLRRTDDRGHRERRLIIDVWESP